MKPSLKLLETSQMPILEQLQLEEALLRADDSHWCLINQGTPPAIVMGISGKPHQLINPIQQKTRPMPIIRRFSGGGTVVVDENTFFVTLICKSQELPVESYPHQILGWTESLYKPIFYPNEFQLVENDYVIGQKKCGGNAQYLCKDRWLQHTSFLWDYQDSYMNYLLMPPKVPDYRKQRDHSDFLCRLKDYLPSKEWIARSLLAGLEERFIVEKVFLEDVKPFLQRPHRKATVLVE